VPVPEYLGNTELLTTSYLCVQESDTLLDSTGTPFFCSWDPLCCLHLPGKSLLLVCKPPCAFPGAYFCGPDAHREVGEVALVNLTPGQQPCLGLPGCDEVSQALLPGQGLGSYWWQPVTCASRILLSLSRVPHTPCSKVLCTDPVQRKVACVFLRWASGSSWSGPMALQGCVPLERVLSQSPPWSVVWPLARELGYVWIRTFLGLASLSNKQGILATSAGL
jgi:hypothetical protein